MLARTQETVRQSSPAQSAQKVTALHAALRGLFDYAGLFPPAQLPLRTAVHLFQNYASGPHADALSCFVLGFSHLADLHPGEASNTSIPLSITGPFDAPWNQIPSLLHAGLPIRMVEVKVEDVEQVRAIRSVIPSSLPIYFELAFTDLREHLLAAIANAHGRVKLRMGGVTADTFPDPSTVAEALHILANNRLTCKATAGLHHPLRSAQAITYEKDSPRCRMHGFVNLCCAAALIHFGGAARKAEDLLAEEDPAAWSITERLVQWRSERWRAAQLEAVRRSFLMSIGSCSFAEPIDELEDLGWL